MDFLRKHRKICSALAAFMVAVLVVYSYGSFRSYAAAPEVSTLPADDIGAEVAYDADSITPVSYTHLDVYKRQVLPRISEHDLILLLAKCLSAPVQLMLIQILL